MRRSEGRVDDDAVSPFQEFGVSYDGHHREPAVGHFRGDDLLVLEATRYTSWNGT